MDRDGEDYPAVCVGKPKGIGLIIERNEIDPIPLTDEILVKNGFRKQNNSSGVISLDTYWLGEDIGFRIHSLETDYYQFGLAVKECSIERCLEIGKHCPGLVHIQER